MPALLQQADHPAQELVVAAGHQLRDLPAVAQERHGPDHRRRLRALDAARQRHRARPPFGEAGERAAHVEKVDHGVGAPAQDGVGEAAKGQDPVIPGCSSQGLAQEEREPARSREDHDRRRRGGHHAGPATSRGVQIARSPPARMN
jgi:hypothetical protein